jgi:hypothetical protein
MCVIPVSGLAPCQCFSPGATQIESPGLIGWIGSPSFWMSPEPAMTCSVCPRGWVCQLVRAPGSKRTMTERTRAGASASTIGSCHTVPMKSLMEHVVRALSRCVGCPFRLLLAGADASLLGRSLTTSYASTMGAQPRKRPVALKAIIDSLHSRGTVPLARGDGLTWRGNKLASK